MSLSLSSSSLHQQEVVQRLSTLNKLYKDCQLSSRVVYISIIVIGVICILSGVLLTSLSFILAFSLLPSQLSVLLGAILIGLGSALIAFGIAKFFTKIPQSMEEDQLLAEELLKIKLIAEEKKEEVFRLKSDLEALQYLAEDLKNQLDESRSRLSELLTEREEDARVISSSRERVAHLQNELEEAKTKDNQKSDKINELEIMIKNNQLITDSITEDLDNVVVSQRKTIAQKDQELLALKEQVENLTSRLLATEKSSQTVKTLLFDRVYRRQASTSSDSGTLRSTESTSS
ncbi:hypothetical protein BOKEGFJH_00308 [Chlamydia avium]|nr:hypothetical protein BOKEGFJH_00308 [Chlamydia avium]